MLTRAILEKYLETLLQTEKYTDYGKNGLQIEGQETIMSIGFAVSATQESIQQSVEYEVKALIVHHGLFWDSRKTTSIIGAFSRRVSPLIKHDINLFAYHLPLDAHLEYGNASSLAKLLKIKNLQPFGNYKGMPIGIMGHFDQPWNPVELRKEIADKLNHCVYHSHPSHPQMIQTIGIITGGAQDHWPQAQENGLDAYLTGEMNEYHWHEAKEHGLHMFAAGHHATEKFGIQSLQKLLTKTFSIKTYFFDSKNPA